jgi:preprotein translocase subunit SecG
MDFLKALSEETQLVLVIIVIAVLFVLVLLNNKRNKKLRYDRDKRNFTKNYYKKRRKHKDKS